MEAGRAGRAYNGFVSFSRRRGWTWVPLLAVLAGYGWAQAPATEKAQAKSSPVQQHFASPQAELEAGIAQTRQGHYRQAIPLLRDARDKVVAVFTAGFDLALCYAATGQNHKALKILGQLPEARTLASRAEVQNLRAQVEIALGHPDAARAAFERAAALEPHQLPLYLFLADACLRHADYALGQEIITAGLAQFPNSARLHYEQASLAADTNHPRAAARGWLAAERLAHGRVIGYMARAQADIAQAEFNDAVAAARQGLKRQPKDVLLLIIFAQAVLRSGAPPGTGEFVAARQALSLALGLSPHNAAAQLTYGQLELIAGKPAAAIPHLEAARRAAPNDPAVYARLATAYQRMGMGPQAKAALARLAAINQAHTEAYRKPGAGHAGYEGMPH